MGKVSPIAQLMKTCAGIKTPSSKRVRAGIVVVGVPTLGKSPEAVKAIEKAIKMRKRDLALQNLSPIQRKMRGMNPIPKK